MHPEYMFQKEEYTHKPEGIETDNKYGIFYKSEDDAKEGEEILKVLQPINQYIKIQYSDPNAKPEYLGDLVAPEKLRKFLNKYGIEKIPETIEQYKEASAKLKSALIKTLYNNNDISAFRSKAREVVNRMHGVYDSRSKGSFNQHILGASFASMRNYVVGLINKRLIHGHYNLAMGCYNEGTLRTLCNVLVDALAKGFGEAKCWYAIKSIAALALPIIDKKWLGTFNLHQNLINHGFTDSQVANLKRAKADAKAIFIWGFLAQVCRGLGQAWLSNMFGFDDDDEDQFYEYTGFRINGVNISLKDIRSGKIFENGELLDSEYTLDEMLKMYGIDLDEIKLKYPQEQQLLNYLKKHKNDVFYSWGDTEDKNRYDVYHAGLQEFLQFLSKQYVEDFPQYKSYLVYDSGKSKNGRLCNSILKTIKEEHAKRMTAKNITDFHEMPQTPMEILQEEIQKRNNRIKQIDEMYNHSNISEKERSRLYDEKVKLEKWMIGAKEVTKSYDYFKAKREVPGLEDRKKAFFQRYNVKTEKELREKYNMDDVTTSAILEHFTQQEAINKRLDKGRKNVISRDFQDTYFETEHPTLYYVMGVVDYFVERALLEQESFIPGGESMANLGASTANYLAPALINSEWANAKLHINPKSKASPIEYEERSFFSNMLSEISNVSGLPAFTAAATGVSKGLGDYYRYWRNDKDDIESQIEGLKRRLDVEKDPSKIDDIRNQIEDLEAQHKSTYASKSSKRLKEGDPKVKSMYGSLPYIRTGYILGLFDFLENDDPKGGWEAIKSFKSFHYKSK